MITASEARRISDRANSLRDNRDAMPPLSNNVLEIIYKLNDKSNVMSVEYITVFYEAIRFMVEGDWDNAKDVINEYIPQENELYNLMNLRRDIEALERFDTFRVSLDR